MTDVQAATLKAAAGALRYAAGFMFSYSEDVAAGFYDTANGLERDLERGDVGVLADCCPVCEEVECDGGCPLEDLRAELADRDRYDMHIYVHPTATAADLLTITGRLPALARPRWHVSPLVPPGEMRTSRTPIDDPQAREVAR
jgi:hypothetical protein